MNILFICDGVDYPLAPNPRLAQSVANVLSHTGHTVKTLYLCGSADSINGNYSADSLIPLTFSAEARMEIILEHGAPGGSPKYLRLLRLLKDPPAVFAAFSRILLHHPARIDVCKKKLEELSAKTDIDAIICVCAPYHAAQALLDADIDAKKCFWLMDPLSDNPSHQGTDTNSLEELIFTQGDVTFVTQQMFKRPTVLLKQAIEEGKHVFPLDFPCFVPSEKAPVRLKRENSTIKVVFAGSLYRELRTPHFALDLFKTLNIPNVQVTFVGGGWENYNSDLPSHAQSILGNKLCITGPVSPSDAARYIDEADILLNLGNSNDNQMPSKIFEYFASGKPILSLLKSQTDPSLSYLERYPLSLSIMEQNIIPDEVLDTVRTFINENADKRVDPAQTAELYSNNTPSAVAQALLSHIL